jgi:hypothetical protein
LISITSHDILVLTDPVSCLSSGQWVAELRKVARLGPELLGLLEPERQARLVLARLSARLKARALRLVQLAELQPEASQA